MLLYLLTVALGALIGGVAFMLLPVAWDSTKIGHKYIWLSMFAVKRGALVLQDDGELNFKKFKYDAIGSEKVSIGGDTVTVSDPARSLASFKGKTFALMDETYGVVFRITDAIAGSRKESLDKQGNMQVEALDEDKENFGVQAWIRKYISIPTGAPIDLRGVHYLATGTEKGTDSWLARTWYKFSRIRDKDNADVLKLLIPLAAFVVTLLLVWQIKQRSGGSGQAPTTNNSTTLSVLLFAAPSIASRSKAAIGSVCVVGSLIVTSLWFGFAFVAFPLSFAIGIALGFVATMAFVLFLSLIGAGAWLSTFFLDMGLQTFNNPTLWETDDGYVLEDREIEGTEHKLGKHYITFVAGESAIKQRSGYVGTGADILQREESGPRKDPKEGGEAFGHWIPQIKPNDSKHYLTTYGAVSSLRRGFVGNDTNERHKEAKEEFGDGISEVSSTLIIGATFLGIILAGVFGYVLL